MREKRREGREKFYHVAKIVGEEAEEGRWTTQVSALVGGNTVHKRHIEEKPGGDK